MSSMVLGLSFSMVSIQPQLPLWRLLGALRVCLPGQSCCSCCLFITAAAVATGACRCHAVVAAVWVCALLAPLRLQDRAHV